MFSQIFTLFQKWERMPGNTCAELIFEANERGCVRYAVGTKAFTWENPEQALHIFQLIYRMDKARTELYVETHGLLPS